MTEKETDNLVLESMMGVPIGLMLKYMDENMLRMALRTAINKGIEIGRRQAAESLNNALRQEQQKCLDASGQIRQMGSR